MMRAFLQFAILALLTSAAYADPNVPDIQRAAAEYRKTIEALPAKSGVDELLREIKIADAAGNKAAVVKLYEQLASQSRENFEAWLNLSIAWRALDQTADSGLSAAFVAHAVARAMPRKFEALLLMSSFLRTRLERAGREFESARWYGQNAKNQLAELDEQVRKGHALETDAKHVAGTRQQIEQTRDTAAREAETALLQIGQVTAALDEVYRDIASTIPGLDLETMKSRDSRSAAFRPIMEPGSESPAVNLRVEGTQVFGCLNFSHDLKADFSYREFAQVRGAGATPSTYAIEAKGRSLCLSGLKPGETYDLVLKPEFPSKLGVKLGKGMTVKVGPVPDLPESVTFSSRHFILPSRGPGEVALSSTNSDNFDLEMFRITDRTLHRHIALNHIGGQLPHDEYTEMRGRFAEHVWKGTIRLSNPSARKNEAVKVWVPVAKILDQRREWAKNGELESSRRSFPVTVEKGQAVLDGFFSADAAPFETAAAARVNPGVYALATRDLSGTPTSRKASCEEDCAGFGVQWFVNTDLGLSFYEGDNKLTVVARSLQSGQASAKARIELVTASNRVLAAGETDEHGTAAFDRSLTLGTQSNALVAIMAYHGDDFSFLAFNAERLDLSRLNVDGRPRLQGLSAFIATDRGIYQPNETIEVAALIRDPAGRVPAAIPAMVVQLEARDRVFEPRRVSPQEWKLGGTRLQVRVPRTFRPGIARITMTAESNPSEILGEALVQVGQVVPDRVRLRFVDEPSGWTIRKSSENTLDISGKVSGQYLYGDERYQRQASARNLKAEVQVRIAAAAAPFRNCGPDYVFGRFDAEVAPVLSRQFIRATDDNGILDLQLTDIPVPNAGKPLAATVEVTLFDEAGPLGSRSASFPILEERGWIGIRTTPLVRPGTASGRVDINVDVIRAMADATRIPEPQLEFSLHREHDAYVWAWEQEVWQPRRNVRSELVVAKVRRGSELKPVPDAASASGDCGAAQRFDDLAQNLEIGRYVLTVRDLQNGQTSSMRFHTGVVGTDASQLEPNIFVLSADKQSYGPGEDIVLTADVGLDGEALVALADGDILNWVGGRTENGKIRITTKASANWAGKGIHALATVFRSGTQGTTRAGPQRVLGAAYFEITGEQIGYPATVQLLGNAQFGRVASKEQLAFRVCMGQTSTECLADARPGAAHPEAYAIAFIVDEGLLSLTGHLKSRSDPKEHFHGRKRLGIKIMDNYGRLLLREGGDRPGRLALSNYTSTNIVSLAEGPKALENGRADFTLSGLDLQNGAASIFVIVWSKDYATSARTGVNVRSPVVANLSVPAFALGGDRLVLPLRLENVDFNHEGEYAIEVVASGAARGLSASVGGAPPAPSAMSAAIRHTLRQGEAPKTAYLAVDVAPETGGNVSITVDLKPVGSTARVRGYPQTWSFATRPSTLSTAETISFVLTPQEVNLKKLIDDAVAGSYEPDSLRLKAQFAPNPHQLLLVSSEVKPGTRPILDQLLSDGLARLYPRATVDAAAASENLRQIIGEIISLQLPDGSFAPYRTLGDPSLVERNRVLSTDGQVVRGGFLRTVGVLEFLWLAKTAGHNVADVSLRAARNFVQTHQEMDSGDVCAFDALYATRVLIQMGHNDHARVAEIENCKHDALADKAAAASVWTTFGRADKTALILASLQDSTPTPAPQLSELGDLRMAMVLAFLLEAGAPQKIVDEVASVILAAGQRRELSRTAEAWVVRAALLQRGTAPSKLELADLRINPPILQLRSGRNGTLESETLRYRNLGQQPINVAIAGQKEVRGHLLLEGVLTSSGQAKRSSGGAFKRRYFDYENGKELNLDTYTPKIGDRLVVVIEGSKAGLDNLQAAKNPAKGPTETTPGGAKPNEGEESDNPAEAETPGAEIRPLLIADLLPSAFKVVSNTLPPPAAFPHDSPLRQLQPRGDLRSVETDADRWIALVLPESLIQDTPTIGGQVNTRAYRQRGADGIDLRQGYVVRVNVAGKFTVPAASVETLGSPARTLRTRQSTVAVNPLGVPAQ